MQYSLPVGHGLSADIANNPRLTPQTETGDPSLTDIQYDALRFGVARGVGMLVVAPTSTGKTNIALWAIISWLMGGEGGPRSAAYLVTHRALARQKFEDFQSLLQDQYFESDAGAIVLATGDGVEDATGNLPSEPLRAPLIVATYEKYLAMVAGSGMREDMTDTLVVCDEVQILGDEHRGRNVEILLTLIRAATVGQLVALSAVLENGDARALSDWLGVQLVFLTTREKHLTYECLRPSQRMTFETDVPGARIVTTTGSPGPTGASSVAADLFRGKTETPAVIFCMTRKRVYECRDEVCKLLGVSRPLTTPLLDGLVEDTEAARDLSWLLQHRLAFHTADMLEEERRLVETRLKDGQIDVVFSTTTLAAGVNFPFSTAIFDEWKRWDGAARVKKAISNAEFQNMAGRAGRMGLGTARGHVMFFAGGGFLDSQMIRSYLTPDAISRIRPQVTPKVFAQVSLQLLSSGVCASVDELSAFLLETFSAFREREANVSGLAHWAEKTREAVLRLREWGFVI